jgi:hypothetical protein
VIITERNFKIVLEMLRCQSDFPKLVAVIRLDHVDPFFEFKRSITSPSLSILLIAQVTVFGGVVLDDGSSEGVCCAPLSRASHGNTWAGLGIV